MAPLALAQGASAILRSAPSRLSGTVCVRIALRERKRPLRYCNRYVSAVAPSDPDAGETLVAAGAASDALTALSELDDFKQRRLHVTEFAARVKLRRGLRQAFIRSVRMPRRVRRGQRVRVRLNLQVVRGPRITRSFRLRIPHSMRSGRRRVAFTGRDVDDPDSDLFSALRGDDHDRRRRGGGRRRGGPRRTLARRRRSPRPRRRPLRRRDRARGRPARAGLPRRRPPDLRSWLGDGARAAAAKRTSTAAGWEWVRPPRGRGFGGWVVGSGTGSVITRPPWPSRASGRAHAPPRGSSRLAAHPRPHCAVWSSTPRRSRRARSRPRRVPRRSRSAAVVDVLARGDQRRRQRDAVADRSHGTRARGRG